MRLGVAVICVLLAAAAAAPYAMDLPSGDQLIQLLVSGKLTPKEIRNMMPWMAVRDLRDLELRLKEKHLPSWRFPDAENLPSVDQLIKHLILGNLTRTDLANMKPWMSPQYLLDLINRSDDTDLQLMMTSMPDVNDLSAEELKEQLISGELSPKKVASMMPRMSLHYLLQLKLSLNIDQLQEVMKQLQDTGDLLPADDPVKQLISGNISRKDVMNMTSRMSQQHLLDVPHSLPEKLLQQVNDFVQTDAPRRNDGATSEITEELDQHRVLFLSLGGVLSLAAVLVVAALLMFVGRRRCSQQSAADQPPAMEKLSGAMAGEQLSSDGNDKRPRTTSSGSALGSSRSSVDHHEYEPIRQDLLPPLPFNYHQYEPVSEELLLPLPEASPLSVPSQYDGSCASSQVYDHLLDR